MKKHKYLKFKEIYLNIFRKVYFNSGSERKRVLKQEVFNNPKLTDEQKEDFWNSIKTI